MTIPNHPMKPRWIFLPPLAAGLLFAGCASTDNELSQKGKDRLAREQARADQKQAQTQQKTMRDATQGTTRKGSR